MSDLEFDHAVEGIAIVGMSGRFPGARNVEEYWRNLREGVESIRFFSEEELRAAGVADELLERDEYVGARGVLDEVENFDAEFFGITAREAEIMDPQHRLFLECAWEALENAGYDPERFKGLIGVYAGVGLNTYVLSNLIRNHEAVNSVTDFQTILANDKDYLPTRVSYKLNLRGPSLSVQTACSTSLVAVSLASHGLLSYQCDMALAGGVSVTVPQSTGYMYQEGGISSPDGHCRTFDALAQGTVGGNGAGIVVLKRLSEAVASGDHIYAVIKGSAINNDGANKIGYTAPGIDGQAEVIATAHAAAGVEAESISYVEAHGTATPLGDPIEVAALTQVFRASTERQQFCALGSVKSNMGHLDAAAGVAGLIKTALSLHHRELPPSLHFQQANPQIDFEHSPFYVNTSLQRWEVEGQPLRAGVSSFGIGGTNAHVVLEEAPQISERAAEQGEGWQVLPLSARSPEALQRMSKALAEHLRQHAEVELSDVAFSLQVGRRHFGQRLAVVGRDRESVIAGLEDWETGRVLRGQSGEGVRGARQSEARSREVGFMFSGQGAQYVGMGGGLYEREPVFRRIVDECAAKLKPHVGGVDLRQVLFAGSSEQLRQTEWAQPALFVVEYALAHLWLSWGVKPTALIGHSVGEYVAACVAGVLELEEALAVVALRGRLMQQMASGAMLAVGMSEGEVEQWLVGQEELEVAAVNAGNAVVVAGATAAVERAERELAAEGVLVRRLETSHAFHTELMEPMRAEFEQALRGVRWREPQVRYVSNVSGQWITAAEAGSAEYWGRHVRERVRFGAGVELLLSAGVEVLLEVGPGRVLSGLARQVARERNGSGPGAIELVTSLPALGETASDEEHLSGSVARLWSSGVNIDWESRQAQRERRGRRVPLPGYAFERKRYWVEPSTEAQQALSQKKRRESDPARWFYAPVRKQVLGSGQEPVSGGRWLVFVDESGIGAEIAARLEASGAEVVRVERGEQWQELSTTEYRLRSEEREDYEQLLKRVRESGGGELPERMVHVWGVSGEDGEDGEAKEQWLSLLYLTQALGEQELSGAVDLMVLTAGLYNVTGTDEVRASQATVLGPCRVIPQEYVALRCRVIDVSLGEVKAASAEWMDELVRGLQTKDETVGEVAYRNGRWWIESFAPVTLGEATAEADTGWIRAGGTYLITGGLGGVGLAMAARLAQAQTRLVLLSRTELPPRGQWEQIVAADDEIFTPTLKEKLKQLLALEQAGATVHVWAADVADLGQMQEVIKRVRSEVGPLHGVVHASGIGGGGVMQLLPAESVRATLAAKVQGTHVLAEVLKAERELEWVVLCSSQRSMLGGVGRMDYCAANAYLDAYAHEWQQAGKDHWRVVTINWDTWRETGMAVETAARLGVEPLTEGLSTAEGIDAWARIMSNAGRLPQVIVSTKEFQSQVEAARHETAARLAAASAQDALKTEGETTQSSSARHPRPALSTPYVEGTTAAETELARIWAEALGIEQVGIHDNFFELGGDSVLSLQITARANQAGLRLTPRQVFERQTVAELASVAGDGTGSSATVQYEQGEVVGEVPLMPIQQWFLEQEWNNPHHYNQAVLLAVRERLEPEALREVIKALLAHHDGLRLRYELQPNGEWRQYVITTASALEQGGWFEEVEIKGSDEAEQSAQIEMVAAETQRELHLTTGPLLRVVHMRLTAKEEERLLLVVHHLAMDAISWRVLLEDLARGYEQARQGEPLSFAAKTMSFKQWAETIAAHVAAGGVDEEAAYWTEVRERQTAMKRLPLDDADGQNRVADEQVVQAELNAEETRRLLVEVPQAHHTQITEVLLAGLVQAIGEWTGERRMAVEVEGHGREEVVEGADVSRTVGWFTTQYPVVLGVEGARSTGEVLAQVKREMRRIPGSGMGYGLLKYLGTNKEQWQREPEIGFLYLGQVDQVLQQSGPLLPATESSGPSQSEENARPHLLDITAVVSGGRLQLTWVYSNKLHRAETIQQLAAHYLDSLRDIIHTPSSESDVFNVSEFEEFGWNQKDLADIITKIGATN